ncbi:hypothetical protein Nepgr_027320 [Nepenthes gracilis]|uniref:Coiled-coil domain-containing protein 22 homolog n=1 Tax=Nepenthes gracilis TaxID=150966 RepID=A0AAD3T9U3_NEPGR|nr:hypothetical protein Nepgr_027320 [Nepenthes gracilis]
MEESQEILLNSLKSFGLSIPMEVSSIGGLNQPTLFSICGQWLHIVDETSTFPASLPDSMADRVKFCTELASAIKTLGYIGEMSFHKLLYPSEEDVHKLVRFLVDSLSELSEAGKTADLTNIHAGAKTFVDNHESTSRSWTKKAVYNRINLNYQKVKTRLQDLILESDLPESSSNNAEAAFSLRSLEADAVSEKMNEAASIGTSSTLPCTSKELASEDNFGGWREDLRDLGKYSSHNESTAAKRDMNNIKAYDEKISSHQEFSSKAECRMDTIHGQEMFLMEDTSGTSFELQHLEEEHEIMQEAVKMVFDDQYPVDFYIEQLNGHIKAAERSLQELENHWDSVRKPQQERKRSLMESLCLTNPEAQVKLQKLNGIELEIQSVLSEIRKREEECTKLSAHLEKQPKVAPRRSYIQRITEITKNSRKQDADIERIIKETRELQLESNSIEERLHRTYAVADETVFREAKKDSVGRQAYRLLTSIHESFEQIREKILETDRTRREVADLEAKLAAMSSRKLDIDKLQADLDAFRRENEYLEKGLQNR